MARYVVVDDVTLVWFLPFDTFVVIVVTLTFCRLLPFAPVPCPLRPITRFLPAGFNPDYHSFQCRFTVYCYYTIVLGCSVIYPV